MYCCLPENGKVAAIHKRMNSIPFGRGHGLLPSTIMGRSKGMEAHLLSPVTKRCQVRYLFLPLTMSFVTLVAKSGEKLKQVVSTK